MLNFNQIASNKKIKTARMDTERLLAADTLLKWGERKKSERN
jgi:hypothetical protein